MTTAERDHRRYTEPFWWLLDDHGCPWTHLEEGDGLKLARMWTQGLLDTEDEEAEDPSLLLAQEI